MSWQSKVAVMNVKNGSEFSPAAHIGEADTESLGSRKPIRKVIRDTPLKVENLYPFYVFENIKIRCASYDNERNYLLDYMNIKYLTVGPADLACPFVHGSFS